MKVGWMWIVITLALGGLSCSGSGDDDDATPRPATNCRDLTCDVDTELCVFNSGDDTSYCWPRPDECADQDCSDECRGALFDEDLCPEGAHLVGCAPVAIEDGVMTSTCTPDS